MKIIDQFDTSLKVLKDLRDRINSNENDLEKKNEIIKNQNSALFKQGRIIKDLNRQLSERDDKIESLIGKSRTAKQLKD